MRKPFRGRHEISRRDADRLLDRSVVDPTHRAVADLLAAAAGPALPHETKGERAAVRRYRQAYAASTRPVSRRRRNPRRVGALVTVTATAMLLGGTAYAARSGQLPDPLQRTAHGWFAGVVPAPSPSSVPSPSSSPSLSPSLSSPSGVHSPLVLRDLCVAWQAVENDPRLPPITADDRRALGDAAGGNGKKQIDEFCARLLGPSPSPAVPPSAKGKPGNPSPGVKKSHK